MITTSRRPILGRALASLFCIALALSMIYSSARAQDVDKIAQQEVQRRQASLSNGQAALTRAKAAMSEENFDAAHEEYRNAVALLPDAGASNEAHAEAINGFCESGVKLAEQRVAEGKHDDAESILREIHDPNCQQVSEMLTQLQTSGQLRDTTNPTRNPTFIAKVEEVKRLLADADDYYNSGRYDLAFKKYDQVLALDPYNTAARRGQEKIDNAKYIYNQQAYNETRARQLWQVEKGWEEPVRKYGEAVGPLTDTFQRDAAGTARMTSKLNSIIIPKIEFRDASIREAIDFIRQQAEANDEAGEGKRGVDIVLRLVPLGQVSAPAGPVEAAMPSSNVTVTPPGGTGPATTPLAAPPITAPAIVPTSAISPANARITLSLNQIPLGEALRYIASQAGLKVKVEPYAVLIIPMSEQSNDLITKEYRVPPGFITSDVNVGPSALERGSYKTAPGTGGTGKDTQESTGGHQLVTREGAKEFLETQGVPFPAGASANFLPQSSRLIVRNTPDNLELVDALVEQASATGPRQVEIESKFIEITQTNLKELGFDWLLGRFGVFGDSVKGSGGTFGTHPKGDVADFPFLKGGVPVGQNPVTAGNRSGDLAITANAIDALLIPTLGATSQAPGIFGLAGVFTDPQFQVVIRALNQKKGVDLLSAPRVTTKSGQRALIEVVREFRYPTTFSAPQLPNISVTGGGTGGVTGGGNVSLPAIAAPSTPGDFETRNTGVTLEVEPVVGPDGVTIDLNLVPQVVEFEGFINYGSPIKAVTLNTFMGMTSSTATTVTENVINQPIFSSRKVTTNVSVWDGQTVVLGGLIREDVQKTEDRTPIIGDIPLVGRLFRTNVDQHVKRNLIIFVTARLVNPGGQPVNATEEEELIGDYKK